MLWTGNIIEVTVCAIAAILFEGEASKASLVKQAQRGNSTDQSVSLIGPLTGANSRSVQRFYKITSAILSDTVWSIETWRTCTVVTFDNTDVETKKYNH